MQKTSNIEKPAETIAPQQKSKSAKPGAIQSKLLHCFFAFVLTGMVLACVEFAFALAHVGEDTYVRPDPLLGYVQFENHNVIYRNEGYSASHFNSIGFREREISQQKKAHTTRICVLGDSMTLGLEVPPELNYTRLLESKLNQNKTGSNFEVLNCGVSGYGTGQEFLIYRRNVKQLKPDVVVLTYTVGDAEDNVFQRNSTNPPRPIFRVQNKQLRAELDELSNWFSTTELRFYVSFENLRRHCRILAVLNKFNLDMQSSSKLYNSLTSIVGKPCAYVWEKCLSLLPDPKVPIPGVSVTTVDLGTEPLAQIQLPDFSSIKNAVSNPVLRDLQSAYSGTRSKIEVSLGIIRALNNECKKEGTKLVVVSGPALTNSVFYYKELKAIKQASKCDGFSFIDSNETFPPRQPMEQSPYFYSLHFTRGGHKLMSDLIYNGFLREGLF